MPQVGAEITLFYREEGDEKLITPDRPGPGVAASETSPAPRGRSPGARSRYHH
jgi:hypothetical protein